MTKSAAAAGVTRANARSAAITEIAATQRVRCAPVSRLQDTIVPTARIVPIPLFQRTDYFRKYWRHAGSAADRSTIMAAWNLPSGVSTRNNGRLQAGRLVEDSAGKDARR